METVHLGLDDTDSSEGMCTTYLATRLVEEILKYPCEFIDYPNLIRLNPNIPWKTRGNAAICLRFRTNLVDHIFADCREIVRSLSEGKKGLADPGLVILNSFAIPEDVRRLSERAMRTVITRREVARILKRDEFRYYKEGSGRGLIGALCAIGEEPHLLKEAAMMLRLMEPKERTMIFRSNQGTGAHLLEDLDPEAAAYRSGKLRGLVSGNARIGRGGHVFFSLRNLLGQLECVAYAPSGDMRAKAALLQEGDIVEVGGGIRKGGNTRGKILNVEYLKVMVLSRSFIRKNPICSSCGRSMTSDGFINGFKCGRCNTRSRKVLISGSTRKLRKGLYLPPPSAQRHLAKPAVRIGRENTKATAIPWDTWFELSRS
jgi:tRNA(Ile2) C34 agmatinyltransferase TiaS